MIELMITVAIVAILAAVAVPAYQSHITKTRRAVATACLTEIAQFMERQYTTSMTYVVAALPATTCISDVQNFYSLAFGTGEPTASTFLLTATPIGTQSNDSQCGTLSLNNLGVRTQSGTSTSCWR